MISLVAVIIGSLLILVGERASIFALTHRAAGRQWIRNQPLMHPNSISFMRMPMGLVAAWMWHIGWSVPAFLWFAFWMITDLTDGTIARSCDLMTESGKGIDPLSDKLLYFPVLLYFSAVEGLLPIAWIVLFIVVDTIGQASRMFVARTAANSFGKAKTGLITTIITLTGLHLLHPLAFVSSDFLHLLTICAAVLAFLSFYSKAAPGAWYSNTFPYVNAVSCAISAALALADNLPAAFVWMLLPSFLELFDERIADRKPLHGLTGVWDAVSEIFRLALAPSLLIFVALGHNLLAFVLAMLYWPCAVSAMKWPTRAAASASRRWSRGLSPVISALAVSLGCMLIGPLSGSWLRSSFAVVLVAFSAVSTAVPIAPPSFRSKLWSPLPATVQVAILLGVVVLVSLCLSAPSRFSDLAAASAWEFSVATVVLSFMAGCLISIHHWQLKRSSRHRRAA